MHCLVQITHCGLYLVYLKCFRVTLVLEVPAMLHLRPRWIYAALVPVVFQTLTCGLHSISGILDIAMSLCIVHRFLAIPDLISVLQWKSRYIHVLSYIFDTFCSIFSYFYSGDNVTSVAVLFSTSTLNILTGFNLRVYWSASSEFTEFYNNNNKFTERPATPILAPFE